MRSKVKPAPGFRHNKAAALTTAKLLEDELASAKIRYANQHDEVAELMLSQADIYAQMPEPAIET